MAFTASALPDGSQVLPKGRPEEKCGPLGGQEAHEGDDRGGCVTSVVPDYAALRGQLKDESVPRW